MGGSSLSRSAPVASPTSGEALAQLLPMLAKLNGFYAFESALHVFPLGVPINEAERDLVAWNTPKLWRGRYDSLVDGCLFFAEDVFGEQFALCGTEIVRFNPETGDSQLHAPNLEGWAERILARYEFETGLYLARLWQRRNGPIPPGHRLQPITPFVLGGEFHIGNLRAGDAAEGMRFRADLAHQVRAVPDGATVRLVIT